MKRRISLVIALVLSFLMMFTPIAQAQETKVQITVPISELADIEVVKAPLAETNQADSPPPQTKVKVQILEERKGDRVQFRPPCTFRCSNGAAGYSSGDLCVPC